MPYVYLTSAEVGTVPEQRVYVNGSLAPELICQRVQSDPTGSTAEFIVPTLNFDSAAAGYDTGKLTVYARNDGSGWGEPIFAGWLQSRKKRLRGEVVTLHAQSALGRLRNRPVNFQSDYTLSVNSTRTFAAGGEQQFLSYNPYIATEYTPQVFQPTDILSAMVTLCMDSWWQTQVTFRVDPTVAALALTETAVFRWEYDAGEDGPVLTAYVQATSPLGDQVFRMATWGHVIDFVAHMVPGIQVFEYFTASGTTEIWFAYPRNMGTFTAACGVSGYDFRDIGGTVQDLDLDTAPAEMVNRVAAIGLPASTGVTVMSETVDGDGNHVGLMPDWDLYDLSQVGPFAEAELLGVGSYDYANGTHSLTAAQYQRIWDVIDSPDVNQIGEPGYRVGWEHVGRRWRLPNWFNVVNLERGANVFLDVRTGEQINFQVYVELAVKISDTDGWRYDWHLWRDSVDIDWQRKTVTLARAPITPVLTITPPATIWTPTTDTTIGYNGKKIARVALSFTYSSNSYVPCADTYLDAGGVIPAARQTGISTGEGIVFERPDYGFAQLSNIGMPLSMTYREIVPTAAADVTATRGKVTQEAVDGDAIDVVYTDFLAATPGEGKDAPFIAYTPAYDASLPIVGGEGTLAAAKVIRDDIPMLRQAVRDVYEKRGQKPRAFEATFPEFTGAARRGQLMVFANLANYEPDQDAIDVVTHDLELGTTTIRTTNQPGDTLQALVTGHAANHLPEEDGEDGW